MKLRAGLSFVAVCLGLAFAAESAWGQHIQIRHHFLDDSGFNGRAYASGRVPTPPYFAIHPPVYYSYPVPRSYGYSPFAYPSYVMTPELKAEPKPAMFENPHVKELPAEEAKTKSASQRSASQEQPIALPRVMENPFVEQGPSRAI